ncbi:MAG: TetR/AcrR family transcriptional regulator [Burkholderiaceae bacterium]
MAPKQKHRQPVIDSAVTLFRRHGYSATGLNDIVELSQAPKGSLYHYFPGGKSSIAVAAVDEAGRRVCETLSELANESSTTSDLLKAHVVLLIKWMKRSGFKDGCPITTVLLELSPDDRAVTIAGRQAYSDRIQILCDKLVGDGFSEQRASQLASVCTSAIQGALIQARVQRSGKPLSIAAEQLAQMLSDTVKTESD